MNDYLIQPVPFTDVRLSDLFWLPRIETNRTVTIPFAFEQCEKSGRMYNFERAATVLRGQAILDRKKPELTFDDTDPYKVIEGASYSLAVKPDAKLEAYIDSLIDQIAAAQEPDGYLYTARTINPEPPHPWAGKDRWVLERELSHELYNLGHLYEAATAHFQATGKRSLLDIAIKTADLLDRTFGEGKKTIWPGHQITEMGLVKLFRVTGEMRYLKLAKFLLDARGPDSHKGSGTEYNQSHLPVVEQTQAVGHAVRATYMYAGMADVAAMSGDDSYIKAINAIWDNVVGHKLYITGGIGSTGHGEAFEGNYVLPNLIAYCETCAAIANVYWNLRMFLLHGDAKYIDVLERSLYNGVISGISLDGKAFFYPNPLESDGTHERKPWFGCACCPSNICRFMSSIPGYFYANREGSIYVNLYGSGTARIDGMILSQETNYPWDGRVTIRFDVVNSRPCCVYFRIPGWARGEAVPSDLYQFIDTSPTSIALKINGKTAPIDLQNGYAAINRTWKSGDVVELDFQMPVRRVAAHHGVAADRGRVALQRGPIVYCLESPDNPGESVLTVLLLKESPITFETHADLLGGIVTLQVQSTAGKTLTAIPYYAWANRGKSEMSVWIAESD